MFTNIFKNFPEIAIKGEEESFEDILTRPNLKIERIISNGQSSPPDFWYEQEQGEWVMVVQGKAGLQIEGEPTERVLNVGDFVNIPAKCRHRVAWTSKDETTIWLAIHYEIPNTPNKNTSD